MSKRLNFDATCPNNHNFAVSFTEDEFEDSLKAGTMMFHCNTCEANWSPTKEEIAKIRKLFAPNAT